MNNETKKLFDAPWRATDLDKVEDANGFCVCECGTHQTASNIARLPELYDALAEVMYEGCGNCCRAHDPSLDPTLDRFMDEGCPFNQRDCFFGQHWAILRKARDRK